jgi:hypothetical protein
MTAVRLKSATVGLKLIVCNLETMTDTLKLLAAGLKKLPSIPKRTTHSLKLRTVGLEGTPGDCETMTVGDDILPARR